MNRVELEAEKALTICYEMCYDRRCRYHRTRRDQ